MGPRFPLQQKWKAHTLCSHLSDQRGIFFLFLFAPPLPSGGSREDPIDVSGNFVIYDLGKMYFCQFKYVMFFYLFPQLILSMLELQRTSLRTKFRQRMEEWNCKYERGEKFQQPNLNTIKKSILSLCTFYYFIITDLQHSSIVSENGKLWNNL
jgi:hypothetical protein